MTGPSPFYVGRRVQFDIAGAAAEVIGIEHAADVAIVAGIRDRVLSFYYWHDGRERLCKVTCSLEMAACLLEALRFRATVNGAPSDEVIECATAVAAILKALEADQAR